MKILRLMMCFICIWVTVVLHANTHPWENLPLHQQADALHKAILSLDEKAYDSIISLSEQLGDIAEKLEDNTNKAFSLRQLGWAYEKKKALSQSIRYYFKAEKIYQELDDNGGLGTVYFNIGRIFARAHNHQEALNYLVKAKEHYTLANEPFKVSKALYEMARRHTDLKDPDTATDLLYEALEICPDQEISHISMINNRLGWAAKDRKEYTKARAFYEKSLSVLGDADKWIWKKGIAYNNIGETYLLEGQYDKAAMPLEKALAIKNNHNNPQSSLETLTLLARLDYKRGNIHKAIERLDQGLSTVDTKRLCPKIGQALALITEMANDPEHTPLPYASFNHYMKIQQQQFRALQSLKKDLDKSASRRHIEAGKDLHFQDLKGSNLQASLVSQKDTYVNIFSILTIIAVVAISFGLNHWWGKRKAVKAKDNFVSEQMKNYDQRILQMLIVKAEYEEIKLKLKKDFGLDDKDFSV